MTEFTDSDVHAALDGIVADVGASPVLKLFTGTKPGIPGDPDTGTLLVSMTLPITWLGAAGNRQKAKAGTWAGVAVATGVAGYWRLYKAGACRWQGTVTGPAGTGELKVSPSTSITSGQPVNVASFVLTGPASGTSTAGASGVDATINPPVLSLVTANNVWPPVASVSLDDSHGEDDVLRVQASVSYSFGTFILNNTVTLNSATIAAGTASFGLSGIASGASFIRARVERGAAYGAWSNIRKHGDSTAPALASSATPSIPEETLNPTFVATLNEEGTIAITGGDGSSAFSTAQLTDTSTTFTFIGTPNYEVKATYGLDLLLTDLAGNTTATSILVAVGDVDEQPDAFSFTAVTGAAINTVTESPNTVTVAGLGSGVSVPVTVDGLEYSKNGAAYTSAPGTVINGNTLRVRKTSSGAYSTDASGTINVGQGSAIFTVTTSLNPSGPSFIASTNQAPTQNLGYGSAVATFSADFQAGRAIIAVDQPRDGRSLLDVSIDGVACTLLVGGGSIAPSIWISNADLTAATRLITVTFSAAMGLVGVMTGTLVNASTPLTPISTAAVGEVSQSSLTMPALTVPADGLAVVFAMIGGGNPTSTNGVVVSSTADGHRLIVRQATPGNFAANFTASYATAVWGVGASWG